MTLPITLTTVVDADTAIEMRALPGGGGLLVLSGPQPGGNCIYIDVADVADLRRRYAAIGDALPPAPGPPREPSATSHPQGTVIPDGSS